VSPFPSLWKPHPPSPSPLRVGSEGIQTPAVSRAFCHPNCVRLTKTTTWPDSWHERRPRFPFGGAGRRRGTKGAATAQSVNARRAEGPDGPSESTLRRRIGVFERERLPIQLRHDPGLHTGVLSPPVSRGPAFAEIAGAPVRRSDRPQAQTSTCRIRSRTSRADIEAVFGPGMGDGSGPSQYIDGPIALSALLQDHGMILPLSTGFLPIAAKSCRIDRERSSGYRRVSSYI